MELDEEKLRKVPDSGILHTLESGIQIQRRKKHEPIALDGLTQAEMVQLTDKNSGSKFLPGTTLSRIVEITCEILMENKAVLGTDAEYTKDYAKIYDEAVGVSRGRRVRAVKVRRSNKGRYAHAYPEDEDRI